MLNTEKRNLNTMHIDKMSSLEIAELMNRENMVSVMAVEKAMPQIAQAIDAAACARTGASMIQFTQQGFIQNFIHQAGLAGTGYTRHAGQRSQRDLHIDIFQIILRCTAN